MKKSDPMTCSICNKNYKNDYLSHMERCYENVKANGATGKVKCDGCNQEINIIEYPCHRLIEVTSAKHYVHGKRCTVCACVFSSLKSLARHCKVFHSDLNYPNKSTQPAQQQQISTASEDVIQTDIIKKKSSKNILLYNEHVRCSICDTVVEYHYNEHFERCYTAVKSMSYNDSLLCDCCNQQVKVIDYPIHRLRKLTNNKNFSGKRSCKLCGCRFHNHESVYKHYQVFHPDSVTLPETSNLNKNSKIHQRLIKHQKKHQILKRVFKERNASQRPLAKSSIYKLLNSINHSTTVRAATSLPPHPITSPPGPLDNSQSPLHQDSPKTARFNATVKYNPAAEDNLTCSICNAKIKQHYNTHLQNCYEIVKHILPVEYVDCDGCAETIKIADYPIHRLRELTMTERFKGKKVCRHCGCRFYNCVKLRKHKTVFHSEIFGSVTQAGPIVIKTKTAKRKRESEELTQEDLTTKDSQRSSSLSKRSLTSPSFSSLQSKSSTLSSGSTLHDDLSKAVSPYGSLSQSLITPPHLTKENPSCGFCSLKMPLDQCSHVARCHYKYFTNRSINCSEMFNCSICKKKFNYQEYALHFHQEFCKIREEEGPLKCDACECTFKETVTLRLHRLLHMTMQ